MHDYKTILRYQAQGLSIRKSAELLSASRNTVSDILKLCETVGMTYEKSLCLTNEEIYRQLYPDKADGFNIYVVPDFEYIHKELTRPGVTLSLLWEEYVEQAKKMGRPFYHRSYFFEMYGKYVSENKLTMHICHKPGDRMQVDWDGKTMEVHDRCTGEVYTAYIFVATLPFSMKCFVKACPDMQTKNWISCHIEAYEYFEGVTRILVSDNLKTGVISNKKHEDPVLNKNYMEMADHYDTVIIPTRVRRPRDKGAVEGSVYDITNYIFGKLRDVKFFSFDDLNKAIREKMEEFNNEPFQKRDGSRNSVYEQEEKPFMKPLPSIPYEICEYKKCRVNIDYHISVEKMNYSVPYEYRQKEVEVKISDSFITVFYKGTKIARHKRLYGRRNQYSTYEEHMPEDHKKLLWNGERFRRWAASVGNSTYEVIDRQLKYYKAEEAGYRGCLSILKLSDKYGETRLENACKLALEHLSKPGYKNIKAILDSGQDNNVKQENCLDETKHACLRGGEYYGNKRK